MYRLTVVTDDTGEVKATVSKDFVGRVSPYEDNKAIEKYLFQRKEFLDNNPDMTPLEAGQHVLAAWFYDAEEEFPGEH